ncbi:hypothetical protein [Methanobrevibacter sp.]|uniref:hypothetical protein n=1 Tax=Methanobrevibacter sp. TaxID=66852 RepID=UPI00388CF605
MDSKGNISLEIAMILIIFILIMGTALSLSETSNQKAVRNMKNEHDEVMVESVVDNLINNPGNTHDWEGYEKGTLSLAIVNNEGEIIPNSVSYEKFMELNGDYEKYINRYLFKSKMKSSIELIPQESIISSVKIGNKETSDNIYAANRLVKCDFYKKYAIKDFSNEGKCNHNHKKDKYSCNYFKLFKGNLKASNYYLLLDENEIYNVKYLIDNTNGSRYESWKNVVSDKIYLNNDIDIGSDSSAVVFVHIDKPKAKAVLVSVPKNFDKNKLKYDYFRTNECKFILKAWY